MTTSTEQERADFEREWIESTGTYSPPKRSSNGDYVYPGAYNAWKWWQAARRAPAVPVPQLDLSDAGLTAIYKQANNEVGKARPLTTESIFRAMRAVAMLAAAPQPPEVVPDCLTCNDHGAVGNILNAEPCPDCTIKRGTGCSVSNGETNAAPVQLPEPQAEIEVRSMKTYLDLSIHEWRDTLPDGAYNIYTEQQVRELLAAHGITGKEA